MYALAYFGKKFIFIDASEVLDGNFLFLRSNLGVRPSILRPAIFNFFPHITKGLDKETAATASRVYHFIVYCRIHHSHQ